MKKYLLVCFALLLMMMLCACNHDEPEIIEPVNFYYCNKEVSYNSDSGVIQAEIREGRYFLNDAEKMLRVYLTGPQSTELSSPLPFGTRLVNVKINDNIAKLTFSNEFSDLSALKLTTACSCIVMTLNDYCNVDEVHFSVEEGHIENKNVHIVKMSDIILMDYMQGRG